jgi:hypothetical protein
MFLVGDKLSALCLVALVIGYCLAVYEFPSKRE